MLILALLIGVEGTKTPAGVRGRGDPAGAKRRGGSPARPRKAKCLEQKSTDKFNTAFFIIRHISTTFDINTFLKNYSLFHKLIHIVNRVFPMIFLVFHNTHNNYPTYPHYTQKTIHLSTFKIILMEVQKFLSTKKLFLSRRVSNYIIQYLIQDWRLTSNLLEFPFQTSHFQQQRSLLHYLYIVIMAG